MEIPEINQRIRQIIDFKTNGNVKKFSDLISISQQTLNRLFNLDTRTNKYPVATTDILTSITEMFVDIDSDWLLTGRGEMIKNNTIVNFGNYSVSQFKQRGYAPYYSLLKVSSGQYDLATIEQNEVPDSWIKFPELTVDAWFPIVGFSMEPKIYAGDIVGVVAVNNWERIDPDKIYLIITIYDRMIKHLQQDESTSDFLWATSENYPRFKIYMHEIVKIYRVVFAGRLV